MFLRTLFPTRSITLCILCLPQDIIPHKIKYGDYLKMMEDDSDCEVISSSSDSDDSASDDDVIAVKPGT